MTKFAQSGVLSNILLVEACEDLYDTAMWSSILETVVSGLLNITKLSDVSMCTRLAVCIVVVGSQRRDIFSTVFSMMSEWESIGGPFWVIQEELLRHAAIYIYRNAIRCHRKRMEAIREAEAQTAALFQDAEEIATQQLSSTTRTLVIECIERLREEFGSLLFRLACPETYPMMDVVDEYAATYPLDAFCTWYVTWAQNVLKTCLQDEVFWKESVRDKTDYASVRNGFDIQSPSTATISFAPVNEAETPPQILNSPTKQAGVIKKCLKQKSSRKENPKGNKDHNRSGIPSTSITSKTLTPSQITAVSSPKCDSSKTKYTKKIKENVRLHHDPPIRFPVVASPPHSPSPRPLSIGHEIWRVFSPLDIV
mmetsp:Transcript_4824/g.7332  ORF Transcript_4824/g.7332 Transcript_4824/m.7332 type:complete len:367 (+) Transcript_4824:374-1474(+)